MSIPLPMNRTFDHNWERNEFQKIRYKDAIEEEIFMAPFYFMDHKEVGIQCKTSER